MVYKHAVFSFLAFWFAFAGIAFLPRSASGRGGSLFRFSIFHFPSSIFPVCHPDRSAGVLHPARSGGIRQPLDT